MKNDHTEHSTGHLLPGIHMDEPASIRKAYRAPTFICLDTALTAGGWDVSSDGTGVWTGS